MKLKQKNDRLKLIFAWRRTRCRVCGKIMWLEFFYGIPGWLKDEYGMGPYNNEYHCQECHGVLIEKEGYCYLHKQA